MRDREVKDSRGFFLSFLVVLGADLAAYLLQLVGNDQLNIVLMVWFGPMSTILYLILGWEALIIFLDPTGTERPAVRSSTSMDMFRFVITRLSQSRQWCTAFLSGSRIAMLTLTVLVSVSFVLVGLLPNLGFEALLKLGNRHLLGVITVSFYLGVFLMAVGWMTFERRWLTIVASCTSILLLSAWWGDRFEDTLHHLLSAPENLQAWGLTLAWSAASTLKFKSYEAN